jgi:hypothetical protein
MNDNNGGLYFIVGALVVLVGIGVFLFNGGYIGGHGGGASHTSVERSTTVTPAGDTTTTITRDKTP